MLTVPPIDDHDHTDGPRDAAVVLVEYADFECPYCVKAYPELEQVRDKYRGQLLFVYRHVPRSAKDGFTKPAAQASEAAAAQGKFWEMHRELFLHPTQHSPEGLVALARNIGLDVPRFQRELEDHTHAARVNELAVRALRNGVIGVPTLFLDGQHLEQPPVFDALDRAIAASLAAARDR
jgi:formate-nitrite transporter family protein